MTALGEPMLALHRLRRRGFERVALAVADRTGVPILTILGRARAKSVTAARHELFALLRAQGLSYPEVGALIGVDHTTVISGVRSHALRGGSPAVRVRVAVEPDVLVRVAS